MIKINYVLSCFNIIYREVMSIALRTGPFIEDDEPCRHRRGKSILKAKENIVKPKCLRKKLKKYKLRKDGQEDPDVIDVSQTLIQSLKLKSPNRSETIDVDEYLERPKNYLFKMVRKKQSVLSETNGKRKERESECIKKSVTEHNVSEENMPVYEIKEKKQTNAFQLLMDSRNKSIGSNSPGKEKDTLEPESEEVKQKKLLKTKRNLALQKLAEAKGSLKKKEIEKLEEECIKQKMDKRAERLKNMIIKGNKKVEKQKKVKMTTKKLQVTSKIKHSACETIDIEVISEDSVTSVSELKLVSEKDTNPNDKNTVVNNQKARIIKEDEDFLKKLSPSMKKKENMLSYFKKIDKDPEPTPVLLINDEMEEESIIQTLKVKMTPNSKKKKKKRKLSLNNNMKINKAIDGTEINTTTVELTLNPKDELTVNPEEELTVKPEEGEVSNIKKEKPRKRKRKTDVEPIILSKGENPENLVNTVEGRPKRNVKKPIKYTDDMQLSSSDEELHILTPKKKKLIDHKTVMIDDSQFLKKSGISRDKSDTIKKQKLDSKCKGDKMKAKLAPIFVAKTQEDVAALEAKQKFLHSGIPDQLKKAIAYQKEQTIISSGFYPVVHVQQIIPADNLSAVPDFMKTSENNECMEKQVLYNDNDIKKFLCLDSTVNTKNTLVPTKCNDVPDTLHKIKLSYPEFPVYRTYKTLSCKSKGNNIDFNSLDMDNSSEVLNNSIDVKAEDPKSLSWTDKYKATSTKHIIGNFDSTNELKKWLITWSENNAAQKNSNEDSDSDFYNSDTDSRDNMRISNNLLVLTGPAGSGKTSSVYAVATELALKVIEVNVGTRRTGKILLQDLQEATQSHKVNRGKSCNGDSQNTQELFNNKKLNKLKGKKRSQVDSGLFSQRSEALSQNSQEEGRTAMSLILIDDADIVFEQDDGFISGIAQLVQCSKRPVILVTTSVSCSHLQRFLLGGNVVKMNPLSPRMLGTWLDIMCLADTGFCWPGSGAKFLDYFKGDMRKCINYLQYLVVSEAQQCRTSSTNVETEIVDAEDENSNFSWAGQELAEDKTEIRTNTTSCDGLWQYFTGNPSNNLFLSQPLDLLKVWWCIPNALEGEESTECKTRKTEKNRATNALEDIADVLDSISLADCMSFNIKPDAKVDVCSNPWSCTETDSVSEKESLEDVNNFYDLSSQISCELLKRSLDKANHSNLNRVDLQVPGLLEERKKEKIISRHQSLVNAVNPNSLLDRKSIALDYWATCRTICRIEQDKTDNVVKRNNRFCHYLKSVRVMCKNEVFNKLCESLKSADIES
ncbi:ATPase family AAA domain-containing protein 5 isoform X1 [Plutella xylostella]|uniref:ATPase family AAA domain-containing protein 5 isoform X1 n=2 Tax=Plutella xylostella TaxID=51655 RepID=UPI0020329C22|nr:ATPase family AAA domain-containing protein 5 isoform X1 [Plutella xylostella]